MGVEKTLSRDVYLDTKKHPPGRFQRHYLQVRKRERERGNLLLGVKKTLSRDVYLEKKKKHPPGLF